MFWTIYPRAASLLPCCRPHGTPHTGTLLTWPYESDQARFWRVEGNKLFLTSAPIPNPNVAGGMMIATVVWEREQ
jgi:hypothetical protein